MKYKCDIHAKSQVTFVVCEDYIDIVWCDVLSLDSGDILLGHPWMYDKNGTHGMCDHTYTFMYGGKEVTLHPMKQKSQKKRSLTHAKGCASCTPCLQRQHQDKMSPRSNSSFNLGE